MLLLQNTRIMEISIMLKRCLVFATSSAVLATALTSPVFAAPANERWHLGKYEF